MINKLENVFLVLTFIGFVISILFVNYIHYLYVTGVIVMSLSAAIVYILENVRKDVKWLSKDERKIGKQPRRLTLCQKKMISAQGYDYRDYMFHVETKDKYIFKHKENGMFLDIDK